MDGWVEILNIQKNECKLKCVLEMTDYVRCITRTKGMNKRIDTKENVKNESKWEKDWRGRGSVLNWLFQWFNDLMVCKKNKNGWMELKSAKWLNQIRKWINQMKEWINSLGHSKGFKLDQRLHFTSAFRLAQWKWQTRHEADMIGTFSWFVCVCLCSQGCQGQSVSS